MIAREQYPLAYKSNVKCNLSSVSSIYFFKQLTEQIDSIAMLYQNTDSSRTVEPPDEVLLQWTLRFALHLFAKIDRLHTGEQCRFLDALSEDLLFNMYGAAMIFEDIFTSMMINTEAQIGSELCLTIGAWLSSRAVRRLAWTTLFQVGQRHCNMWGFLSGTRH